MVSFRDEIVAINTLFKATCSVSEGDLPISHIWYRVDGHIIMPSDNNETSATISITPTQRSDYGNYTCTATNILGSSNYTLQIIEAGKGNRK